MKKLVVLVLFFAWPSYGVEVKDFMQAVVYGTEQEKENMAYYFNGALDVTMDFGIKMNALCFPEKFPARERLLKEFLVDLGNMSLSDGEDKIMSMQVDTALQRAWLERYGCQK